MNTDPVVQEVRDNGARIAQACGGDVHRMAEYLRRNQGRNTERIRRRSADHVPNRHETDGRRKDGASDA
jgi:hypothetical protein